MLKIYCCEVFLHYQIELEYYSDIQNAYQNLSQLPGFVLLESTDRFHGRYDIVSAYPYERIVIDKTTHDKQAVLDYLRRKLLLKKSVGPLPFQGGAIGYISYDLGAELHGICSPSQPTLNDMPLLDLGLYNWAIITDHKLKKVELFVMEDAGPTMGIIDEVVQLWSNNTSESICTLTRDFHSLVSREDYQQAFNNIKHALYEGRSYQVNLTQAFLAGFTGDPWGFYKKVSNTNPVPYSAFLRTSKVDVLSFSPERFLFHEDGHLLTSPIKGTIGRSDHPADDVFAKDRLKSSAKNYAENVMIVDLLRNDLGKIAKPGSVEVTSLCAIQSYKSVHHLVSDLQAECIEGLHPLDLFLSCFPGGSITGAPKLESMKIINEQEPYGRGIYCGSIGYFSFHGRFDTNVAIRTVTAKNNMLHLSAGGGIVIDSESEDEYRECYIKIDAIINGLK